MATATRVMDFASPLGEGVLLFHGMRGREELGRLSEYHLDLLSADGDIDVDAILGKNVTIKLALPDDSTRYFNGFVTRFSQGEVHGRYYHYSATVHPWLWFLTRTADCRIFQDMTVPDIIKKVFADHGTADFKLELTSTYRKWTYCVQYRETDFNFVSRLMEQEGIYYYFRHTEGHNTMVLTDSCSKHVACSGYEKVAFIAPDQLVRPELEHISSWQFSREIQPGKYVHKDYDLERPSVDLKTQKVIAYRCAEGSHEIFDYPGEYLQKADGEQLASVRIDEMGTQFETARGVTNARGLAVGALFTLDKCPRSDQNREHLVVSANYDLEFSDYEAQAGGGGASYRCSLAAMSTKQQFRPRRTTPKPFVQGPQTAMVVGPAGDEIHTDQFGRVKVQFHWDRLGQNDENSSCWIRVSQPWAGKGWGAVSTPRIGQEVVVDFLEGDPDQPIITGRVYNAESQPPFGFPAGAVLSGIKSNTHKGAGYNELSMDDTAGKEKVTIHAQYDMNTTVLHDQTTTVVNGNRAMTIQTGTLTDTVKGNASLTVQAGSRTVDVTGGDYAATASNAIMLHGKSTGVTITGDAKGVGITGNGEGVGITGNGEGVAITGNGKGVGITGNGDGVAIVGNATGVGIEGYGEGVAIKGDPDFFAEGTSSAAIMAPIVDIGDKEINIIGTKITIAAGASSIVLDAGGITIQGPLVKIN